MTTSHTAILGSLLGTAVGDAFGLPYEGMSRERVRAFGEIRHRFLGQRGMFSDDTEHTLMLAAAMHAHRDDLKAFQRNFAWKLRWWLLGLPAGVGLSTAKAILRLWVGFPPSKSGVCSAGNGAAMRSAIVGVFWADDELKRHEFALTACRITHTDPRAEESALLVAEAAALASNRIPTVEALNRLRPFVRSEIMKEQLEVLKQTLSENNSVSEFATRLGCGYGVSGFAPHTVAVALFAWLRHRDDFEAAVRSVIECGGDTDTVAAITGGICGAEVGEAGIPSVWIADICDWPRSVAHIREVAAAMADSSKPMPCVFWPLALLRNVVFLAIVLLHGFRRLLPPY
ncbi:MAG: ADP-ribosylglycohydrolase family protein [Verrucomicrobiaceae bacterium]|nr:ADP-ribosylglycohydrolase family protein [Verrucomicrobiaceae bacterium]